RHGPFVAGRHCLQHVEGFLATHLTDNDTVGPHSECVFDQLSLPDLSAPLDIWWTGLKTPYMRLLQLQLGGILDGDQTLLCRNEARQGIEKRRLARARAASDENGHPSPYGLPEYLGHRRTQCAVLDQSLHFERTFFKQIG